MSTPSFLRRLSLTLGLAAPCLAQAVPPPARLALADPPPHHLVRVTVKNRTEMQRLLALELDLAGCCGMQLPPRVYDAIATAADLATIKRSGLAYEVAIENVEAHYARELAASAPPPAIANSTLNPPLGQGGMGGHYTLAEMEAILDSFARTYPSICAAKVSIGRSVEGRDLWMVKISDNVGVDESEPEVYYDALHHAREPVSMAATLLFMDSLLAGHAAGDPEFEYLVNEREFYFVPCVNPDGYEYNRSIAPGGGGMWRKNRRGGYGVDLNRNYSTQWGGVGSSGSQTSDLYRGAAPLSEPETAAIDAFLRARQFVQAFSTHTYAEVLLRPWCYQPGDPSNVAAYERVARVATATTGMRHGAWYSQLYPSSGTAVDHHHVVRGSLAWTAELGTAGEGGFWPSPTNQVNIATRHQYMFKAIALLAGPSLSDADLILMASGRLGSVARFGMLGTSGAFGMLALSSGVANLAISGITGNLLLDPAALVVLPALPFDASGYIALDVTLPSDPGLRGTTTYWQVLHVGATPRLGNRQTLALR
jgi:murein tripeptide amidase MpaA